MTTLIIGGTGFIGRRLIPLLAKQGETSVVMDINPQTANYSELAQVRVLRGDVSQFDDVMAAMIAVKPDRVINLAYYIQACAGPGATPPCVLLNGDAVATGSFASIYVDRNGQTFGADARLTLSMSYSPDSQQALDGSFTLKLMDGRSLSGTFRTCLLATINWA